MTDFWCLLALVGLPVAIARSRPPVWILALAKLALIGLAMLVLQMPLVLAAMVTIPLATVGLALGWLVPRGSPRAALLLAAAAIACAPLSPPRERAEEVRTAILVPAGAEAAFARVKSFGALEATPTGLLAWGLPVPRRCELEHDGLGARRTCHFDRGRIDQRIIGWQPPRSLELEIVASDLPFQPFRFTRAAYVLEEVDGGTRVTRSTSYVSRLAPRWFWRPLEQRSVAAEHDYLLGDLAATLAAGRRDRPSPPASR
jgi:hypothetical protein